MFTLPLFCRWSTWTSPSVLQHYKLAGMTGKFELLVLCSHPPSQVEHLDIPEALELRKLRLLKDELGELAAQGANASGCFCVLCGGRIDGD